MLRTDWPAGTAFGKFLARNTSLEELDLSGNELHNEGVYSFRDALIDNHTLIYLNLASCGVADEVKKCDF